MKPRNWITMCCFLILVPSISFGQNVNITIVDSLGFPIPSCWIKVFQNGDEIPSSETGFDGKSNIELNSFLPVVISVSAKGFMTKDSLFYPTKKSESIRFELDRKIVDYRLIFNEKSAISDIKEGNIKILFIGLCFSDALDVINDCTKKYGFTYTSTNDVLDDREFLEEAVNNYNEVIIKYLDAINEPEWKLELLDECDVKI